MHIFIDHYETVQVCYASFDLVFRDTKTGEDLHTFSTGKIRREGHEVLIDEVKNSDNKLRSFYHMCGKLADEYEKAGFRLLNHWRGVEASCRFEMVKWQRFLDSGDIEVIVVVDEYSLSEQQKKRVAYEATERSEPFISVVKRKG